MLALSFDLPEFDYIEEYPDFFICCISHPLRPICGPYLPVIFEVIGRIAVRDCYLTSRGDSYQWKGRSGAFSVVGCWIERDDIMDNWDLMSRRLCTIATSTGFPMDIREVYKFNPGVGISAIQVSCVLPPARHGLKVRC